MTEFERIVSAHRARYPQMEPQDLGKLAYQSEFGPGHLVTDELGTLEYLCREWEQVPPGTDRPPEDIGGGLCRFYLNDIPNKNIAAKVLVKLFCLTAEEAAGRAAGLEEKLAVLEKLPVPGMGDWLAQYRERGCPPVRHSGAYRAAYCPSYRLLKWEYARAFPALLRIAKLDRPSVIAIDGRCGCGKTSLAALTARLFDCNVFHMDDFYLPREQRQENWLEVPGGNMDLVRFRREVLEPVFAGREVVCRPFDCGSGTLGPAVTAEPKELTVIEGSYSHHPDLGAEYSLKLFVTCEKKEQLHRLKEREGDYFPTFQRVWMPLEEQYIRLCGVEEKADLVVDTGV